MTRRLDPVPAGMHTITPHLVVRGAATAADWYVRVFGAVERRRVPIPDGRLMSVELWFGDSAIMLADEFPEVGAVSPLSAGGTGVVLHLFSTEVDSLWRRALDAGADVVHPLADQFWGERHGQIRDPFGHRWGLAQRLREVSPDEVAKEAWLAFGGQVSDP
jgi:PhnB protein